MENEVSTLQRGAEICQQSICECYKNSAYAVVALGAAGHVVQSCSDQLLRNPALVTEVSTVLCQLERVVRQLSGFAVDLRVEAFFENHLQDVQCLPWCDGGACLRSYLDVAAFRIDPPRCRS